jgi:nitrogen fixation NifU-like protein
MYSQKVLDIFYEPQHVGVIKGANGVGKVVDETCGEIVKIYILVENDKVIDAQFQAFGGPALIAATSVATSLMVGKTLEECNKITSSQILAGLGGQLPDTKHYVCPLAESVVKSAVASYYRRAK